MSVKISVIIVSFNCREMLSACLKSIYESDLRDFEVIVTDNASSDDTVEMLSRLYPQVKLIQNKINIGFGAACNLGAEAAQGGWLFFLNPDTEVKIETFTALSRFIDSHPAACAAGAKLLWPDGSYQDSYKRFFSPFFSMMELFELHYYFPKNPFNLRVNYNFEIFNKITKVDWVIGAALAVKRECFKTVGGFDPDFFMYFEETDLCRRIAQRGGEVFFIPDCEVIHKKGKVSEKTNVRSVAYYKSMYLYHSKSSSAAAGILIRISIFLMCLSFLFVLSFKLIFMGNKKYGLKRILDKLELLAWSIGL
ncbi:MAG: hypothetical protein Fur0012_08630 [Elusimicrobiota bacterium]